MARAVTNIRYQRSAAAVFVDLANRPRHAIALLTWHTASHAGAVAGRVATHTVYAHALWTIAAFVAACAAHTIALAALAGAAFGSSAHPYAVATIAAYASTTAALAQWVKGDRAVEDAGV